jgi:hypothetical protein
VTCCEKKVHQKLLFSLFFNEKIGKNTFQYEKNSLEEKYFFGGEIIRLWIMEKWKAKKSEAECAFSNHRCILARRAL